jgi:WD40 repeat protein
MRVIASQGTTCFIANGNDVLGLDFTNNSCKIYKFEKNEGSAIITITVANDGKYVFAGYSSKVVCCWDINTGELLGSGLFKKRPTAIVYSTIANSDRAAVLVSDKTGDVWGSDVPLLKNQTILAGHTASVVTDMEIHNNLVVTADRDEKLRVSRFPDLETIVSYCLGHTSVVSSATFLSVGGNALLVSVSWDHRLCLWNPLNGKLLATKLYPNTVVPDEEEVAVDEDASEPVDEEAGEEEEEEELEEKTYDERTAGNFPFKVTACSSTNTIAVIFRNMSTLKLYRSSVQDYSPSSSSSSNELAGETSLELLAVPSDIVFLGDRLVALLPQPHYLQVLDVAFNAEKGLFETRDVSGEEGVRVAVQVFVKHCVDTGECAFSI